MNAQVATGQSREQDLTWGVNAKLHDVFSKMFRLHAEPFYISNIVLLVTSGIC